MKDRINELRKFALATTFAAAVTVPNGSRVEAGGGGCLALKFVTEPEYSTSSCIDIDLASDPYPVQVVSRTRNSFLWLSWPTSDGLNKGVQEIAKKCQVVSQPAHFNHTLLNGPLIATVWVKDPKCI